jgi:hypothetical protein
MSSIFKEFKVQCRLVYPNISNYQSLGRWAGMKSFFLLPTGSQKFIKGKKRSKVQRWQLDKPSEANLFKKYAWIVPAFICF